MTSRFYVYRMNIFSTGAEHVGYQNRSCYRAIQTDFHVEEVGRRISPETSNVKRMRCQQPLNFIALPPSWSIVGKELEEAMQHAMQQAELPMNVWGKKEVQIGQEEVEYKEVVKEGGE